MGLRDIGATLPPGFRFYPSDKELVCHYLYKKIANKEVLKGTLVEIDLHTCEPWQLVEVAKLNANEWYFFSFRDRKYATGFRTNRATTSATGKQRERTERSSIREPKIEDWVLCRVFHKRKGGENSNRSSSPMMLEPLIHAPSLTEQTTMACVYHQQMNSLPSKPPHQPHGQACSIYSIQFSPRKNDDDNNSNDNNNHCSNEVSSKVDDDYEFLWDMNMEENSLGDHHHELIHGVASNSDDMIFEIDNSDFLISLSNNTI
ncbi:Detected protein of confused Function [Hibiscus syriacus]|uniref:Detected protein of confused Function n=1 Tax=Hibiscus syriacus TaxID=106335 RepID=A0A6A2Z0Q6_HIBSY|nr:Detected protein of confused Function [Hibiscus syriacus]